MKLIVGLGNPGKTYVKTRHNVGFMVLDAVLQELHLPEWRNAPQDIQAVMTDMMLDGKKIIFAKPQTFMNNAGYAIAALLRYFSLKTADLLVVHDDLDIPLGEIKQQRSRGAAGHNGVQSIIEQVGGNDFSRIRVGIVPARRGFAAPASNAERSSAGWGDAGGGARKPADGAKFVLGRFGLLEKSRIKNGVGAAAKAVQEWMK